MGRTSWFALLVMLTVLAPEVPAEAYLDPGGGTGAGVGEIDDLERGGIAEPGRCSTPFADGRIVHVGKQEPVQLGHVVVDHGPGFAQEVLGLLLRQPRIHR